MEGMINSSGCDGGFNLGSDLQPRTALKPISEMTIAQFPRIARPPANVACRIISALRGGGLYRQVSNGARDGRNWFYVSRPPKLVIREWLVDFCKPACT